MTQRVIVGLLCCVLLVFGACGMRAAQAGHAAAGFSTPTLQETTRGVRFTHAHGAAIDVYGNEVQTAIGDYRVDDRGAIYESHAPDTAVLTLAPPQT